MWAPGQIIAGRYRLEQLLGQGGMGSVYRAVQLSVARPVALKLLVEEHARSASFVSRFEREALALARLAHPHTVRLIDFGATERGCPFLVMELLEGRDLAAELALRGPLGWRDALEVARQLLGSLAEAHAAGIIHRDVKPANVLSCAGLTWPDVKLVDFGIAGGAGAGPDARRLTLSGTVLGSAAYMAPEQAHGREAGPAADLYSLGVVLFEMLTGAPPFGERGFTAQLLAKVTEPAPRLREAAPGLELPAGLEPLVAALLERDVEARPGAATVVLERVEELLLAGRAGAPLSESAHARGRAVPLTGAPPTLVRTEPMALQPAHSPCAVTAAPRRDRSRASLLALAAVVASAALVLRLRDSGRARDEPAAALASAAPASGAAAAPREGGPGGEVAGDDIAGARGDGNEAARSEESEGSAPAAAPVSRPLAAAAPRRVRGAGAGARSRRAANEAAFASVPQVHASDLARARSAVPPVAVPPAAVPPVAVPPVAVPPVAADEPAQARGEGARASAPSVAGYETVAAVAAAAAEGHLTPLQRNELILSLRQRRLEARARAARDHREGRITREELRERQRAIERELEGS